jgi:hypothetical protein
MAFIEARTGGPPDVPDRIQEDCKTAPRVYLTLSILNHHAANVPPLASTEVEVKIGEQACKLPTDDDGLVTFVYEADEDFAAEDVAVRVHAPERGWVGSGKTNDAKGDGNVRQLAVTVRGRFRVKVEVVAPGPGSGIGWQRAWTPDLKLKHGSTPPGGRAVANEHDFTDPVLATYESAADTELDCVTAHELTIAPGKLINSSAVALSIDGRATGKVTDADAVQDDVTFRRVGNGVGVAVERHGAVLQVRVLDASTVRVLTPTADRKQFINIPMNFAQQNEQYGRCVTITAELLPQRKGATVYWELHAQADNRQKLGDKVKGGLLQVGASQDTTPTDVATSQTDDKGLARIVLKLSAYGGDSFRVRAGVQAKQMTTESGWIEVWRKLWFQLTRDPVVAIPSLDPTKEAYSDVYMELEQEGPEVHYDQAWLDKKAAGTNNYYPLQMVQPGAANNASVPVVGAHNREHFKSLFVDNTGTPSEKRKVHLVVIGALYNRNDATFEVEQQVTSSPCELVLEKAVLSPSIGKKEYVVMDLDWFVAGWFKLSSASGGVFGRAWRPLAKADIQLLPGRGANENRTVRPRCLQVNLPLQPGDPLPSAGTPYDVMLRLVGAVGPFGGVSFGAGSTCLVCSKEVEDAFPFTVAHEFAHELNMVPIDEAEKESHPNGFGLPKHAHAYRAKGGIGPHCHSVRDDSGIEQPGVLLNAGTPNAEYARDTGTCIMFHQASAASLGEFCMVCEPYLRAAPIVLNKK